MCPRPAFFHLAPDISKCRTVQSPTALHKYNCPADNARVKLQGWMRIDWSHSDAPGLAMVTQPQGKIRHQHDSHADHRKRKVIIPTSRTIQRSNDQVDDAKVEA